MIAKGKENSGHFLTQSTVATAFLLLNFPPTFNFPKSLWIISWKKIFNCRVIYK